MSRTSRLRLSQEHKLAKAFLLSRKTGGLLLLQYQQLTAQHPQCPLLLDLYRHLCRLLHLQALDQSLVMK